MDSYIDRLNRYLGPDHSSTKGFTIIKDLLKKREVPPLGIFYAGKKNSTLHDLILYSVGEDRIEFKPVPADKCLLTCLENAALSAEEIHQPAVDTSKLIILPFDADALSRLHALQEQLKSTEFHINGKNFHYAAVPLTEQAAIYEEPAASGNTRPAPEPETRLSLQAEALRQGMLARYAEQNLEQALKKPAQTGTRPVHKTTP